MKTENINIKTLSPYKNNARKHTENQVQQIANSIEEFGFVNPILVDENNMILAGHGRYMAAKSLDLSQVPVIKLLDLTEAQKKAFVIADNKIAINSTWDETMLWQEIQELNKLGFDLNILAFNEMEILPITDPNVVDDPLAEWENMPEFVSEDNTAYRTLYVHFETEEDVQNFSKLVGQQLSDKTKFIWYPEQKNMNTESKRYE
jgi:ParB-like chromosome segregation protein Spo0J